MDLDFAKTYANYPTVKLLAIIANAHKYQPEAVAAAQQILASRNITDTDREALLQEKDIKPEIKKHWLQQQEEPTANRQPFTGESIFEETEEETVTYTRQVNLWRRLIAIALSLPFLVYLVTIIYLFVFLPRIPAGSNIYIVYAVNGIASFLVAAVGGTGITLLLLKKRLGWLLAAAFNSYALIAMLGNIFLAAAFSNGGIRIILMCLLAAIVGAAMYLLWQPQLRNSYAISRRTAGITVAVAAILSVAMALYNALPNLAAQM